MFCFPSSRTDTIPKWFEHQSKQPTISFWYRNHFPSIALFFSTKWMHNKDSNSIDTKFRGNLFINGHTCTFVGNENPFDPSVKKKNHFNPGIVPDHTYLYDLNLAMRVSKSCRRILKSKLVKDILKTEWIHAEIRLEFKSNENEVMKSLSTLVGIHMFKKENNMEDIKFTDPYRKRKLNGYPNTSLSLFRPLLKKTKFVEVDLRQNLSSSSSNNTI